MSTQDNYYLLIVKQESIHQIYNTMPTIYRYIELRCSPRHYWAVANASD